MRSSIAEIADIFGVSTRTLRFYEQKGLVTPSRVNGMRVYSLRDRVRIELILKGKRLGLSIDEISALLISKLVERSNDVVLKLSVEKVEAQIAVLSGRVGQLDLAIAELREMARKLDKKGS